MDLLELLHKGGMDGDVDFLREALRVLVIVTAKMPIVPFVLSASGLSLTVVNIALIMTTGDILARIHRRTPMDGVRKAEGG